MSIFKGEYSVVEFGTGSVWVVYSKRLKSLGFKTHKTKDGDPVSESVGKVMKSLVSSWKIDSTVMVDMSDMDNRNTIFKLIDNLKEIYISGTSSNTHIVDPNNKIIYDLTKLNRSGASIIIDKYKVLDASSTSYEGSKSLEIIVDKLLESVYDNT